MARNVGLAVFCSVYWLLSPFPFLTNVNVFTFFEKLIKSQDMNDEKSKCLNKYAAILMPLTFKQSNATYLNLRKTSL